MIDLSSMGKQLFGMLMQIPPDFKLIRSSLESACYTHDDVNRVALQYVDECWGEYVWPEECKKAKVIYPGRSSKE